MNWTNHFNNTVIIFKVIKKIVFVSDVILELNIKTPINDQNFYCNLHKYTALKAKQNEFKFQPIIANTHG